MISQEVGATLELWERDVIKRILAVQVQHYLEKNKLTRYVRDIVVKIYIDENNYKRHTIPVREGTIATSSYCMDEYGKKRVVMKQLESKMILGRVEWGKTVSEGFER
jgi:hypothetical protein